MQTKYIGESLEALVTEASRRRPITCARDHLAGALDDVHRRGGSDARRQDRGRQSELARARDLARGRRLPDERREHALARAPLNYGTQEHEIRPDHRRAETTPEGPRAGAHVRGITPRFMVEHAADTTAATIRETTTVARESWKAEVEFNISRAKRERLV